MDDRGQAGQGKAQELVDAPGSVWDGAPVISSYSRAQAIEDGLLVDVTETAREARFRCPVAMTRAVWEDCVAWSPEDSARKHWPQDEAGRLWDVVWMAALKARLRPGESSLLFSLIRVPREGRGHVPRKVVLRLVAGGGDNGEMVMTILQPDED